MNWITIAWPMAIAACGVLALIHFQIALRMHGRPRWSHFHFACGATAVGAVGVCELLLLHAQDLESYRRLMFCAQIPITAMQLAFTAFALNYFHQPRRSLAFFSVGCIMLCLIGNIALPAEMRVRYAESIRMVETLGGVRITLASMREGWLALLEVVGVASLLWLVTESSIRSWRREGRKNVALVGAGLVFFLLATRGYALLVESEMVNTPFFFIFPILVLLAAMGRQLSLDVFQAAQLADNLRENERRMDMVNRAVHLGLWQWEMLDRGVWMTPITRGLLGIGKDEPVDMNRFIEKIHCDDRLEFQRAVREVCESAGEFVMDCRLEVATGDRERWVHVRGSIDAAEPS
ncbi:MAG TPA: hypothetical protein VFY13_08745, partial [Luteolibacter sp.]|nr:hypothetical protein [Luteolibacter sp.]